MKEEGQHGKSQIIHIYHIRIVCYVFTCIVLLVIPILSDLGSEEKSDGNFYFVGDIRVVSAILVFRQHSYEVNPVGADPAYFMNFLAFSKKIFMK
jgi:hypothetical protein